MYDNCVMTDYVWELGKVNTVLTEVIKENWNQGYDDGQSFGQNEVVGYLRTIAKLYGGMDEHLQSLIFEGDESDSFLQLQEFADELEKREKERESAKPLFINQLSEKAQLDIRNRLVALDPTVTEKQLDENMCEKINILVPVIEDEERIKFEDALNWLDDDELYYMLFQDLVNTQLERRKTFGYDF